MSKKIAIIGGGLGGISAALYLSKYGYEIDIFEKNEKLGGKLNYTSNSGFYFDLGPSLLTMPFVVEDIFRHIGRNIEDYLEVVKLDNICRYFWSDGVVLDADSNISKFKENIKQISELDADNLSKFLDYSKTIYDLTADTFLFGPFMEWSELFKLKNYKTLLQLNKIDSNRTMQTAINSFFASNKLRQLFGRYATYNGSNPYSAPATLNIIPHVEYTLGSFYIKGGMYKLGEVLEKLLIEQNVNIHTNTEVSKILTSGKKVRGIEIKESKEIKHLDYDYVISNSDIVHTNENLIIDKKLTKNYTKYEPSLSGFVLILGINKTFDNLKHHNILFSDDYKKEFDTIFQELDIPIDPTIYISITKKTDDTHAPIGAENWFILLNMPYNSNKINWDVKKTEVRDLIIKKLKKFGFDIEDDIMFEQSITPTEMESMYLTNKGSIYGLSSNSKFSAFLRQSNRNKKIENLYHVGGSVHPGGGIPLVILSGKIASELVLSN